MSLRRGMLVTLVLALGCGSLLATLQASSDELHAVRSSSALIAPLDAHSSVALATTRVDLRAAVSARPDASSLFEDRPYGGRNPFPRISLRHDADPGDPMSADGTVAAGRAPPV